MNTATTTEPAAVQPSELRDAMSRLATGVTIVTTAAPDGRPLGTTANAVTSLSLRPPLILVCLDRSSQTLAGIQRTSAFAVNILTAAQRPLSDACARSGPSDAWETTDVISAATGSPLIAGCAASLDCVVHRVVDGGDHDILIGRVVDTAAAGPVPEPLLFYDGGYLAAPA